MAAETFHHAPEQGTELVGAETTVERTFNTGEYCRLVVENPRGRIRVAGWDRPEVMLRVTKLRNGSNAARFAATRIEIRHEGGTVYTRTIVGDEIPFHDGGAWSELLATAVRSLGETIRSALMPVEVDYEVQVPRHADLDLRAITSRVSVENVRGNVHVASVSGSQGLARVEGEVNLSTVSGEIDAHGLAGCLGAKSVSGSVSLAGSLDAVRANVVSGSVELAGPLATTGSYDVRTVSGSVTLRLPPDTRATVDARGVSLNVTSDLPCHVTRDQRSPGSRHWQGLINKGGATVHVSTVSGHLYLAALASAAGAAETRAPETSAVRETATASSEPVGASPDESERPGEGPSAAPAPESAAGETTVQPTGEKEAGESAQLRVLRALERGELTVDEALEQIEALRGHEQ